MDRCESSEDEYEEMAEEMLDARCLFCATRSGSFEDIFAHTTKEHQLDFVAVCKAAKLNTFQYIKLVNYVRKNNVQPLKVQEVITSKLFDTEDYLKPTLDDDHLLMFDFDDDDDDVVAGGDPQNDTNVKTYDCKQESRDVESQFQLLSKEKVIEEYLSLKTKYEALNKSISQMSEFIRESITDEGDTLADESKPTTNVVANLDLKSDCGYISSYSHFGIHHEMLSDKARTLAYRDAILENANLFKGKTVLDIGCGTGILSLFAAKAGAQIVVAVDQSDIIYNAIDIIRLNGYDKVIKPVKGKLESIQFEALNLPSKYDFIISEWMGYFLLFEGMLDTVLFARDNLLKSEGTLLPNRSKMFFAAFSDSNFFERNIDFWNDVYGFRMSTMIKDVTSEATIDLIREDNICSSISSICELDIVRCSLDSALKVNSTMELKFEQNATIHGFVGWFDCYFDTLTKAVVLSTSPFAEPTHWKQTIFLLKEPLSVEAGKTVTANMEITRDTKDARALLVKLFLKSYNLSLEYSISC